MEDVLAQSVVPFYYQHEQRTFQMGNQIIHISGVTDLYPYAQEGFLSDLNDLEAHAAVYPQFSEPIALPRLADFLAHTDTERLSEETITVMTEVHQDLTGCDFYRELVAVPIYKMGGKLAMDFTLDVHDRLHVAGLGGIGDEGYEYGVFGYNFNNADIYPAKVSLYAGLGHIAALARNA
jgi:hypothetical protein